MTHTHSTELRDVLAALAPSVETTSLYALRMIERTVNVLQDVEQIMEGLGNSLRRHEVEIRGTAPVSGDYLDPEGALVTQLETAYRILKENVARKPHLSTADELLRVATDRVEAAAIALGEATRDLCDAIIAHDLAADRNPATVAKILEARRGSFETVPSDQSISDWLSA